MTSTAPHLLLRTIHTPSRAAELLRFAGYVVSRVDDALALRLAGAPHIDAIVLELPTLDTLRLGPSLDARYGGERLVLVAINAAADAVRRALPFAIVLTPLEVDDDLVSAVDLAIAARQMRMAG